MNVRKLVALVVVLIALVSACGKSVAATSAPVLSAPALKPISVVTTAYPLFEAISRVGGSRVKGSNLLPDDPFATLSSDQAAKLQQADLVLTLGKGVQPHIDAALSGRTKPTISVLDMFPTQYLPTTNSVDPYVWENPQNLAQIGQRFRDQLTEMDAKNAIMYAIFEANFTKDLDTLDKKVVKELSTCTSKNVVSTDNRFGYLTAHYGLNNVVTNAAELPDALGTYRPSTVFEPTLPSLQAAKDLLSTYQVKVSVLDPLIAQTDQARRGGANYTEVTELNIAALKAGLGCADTASSGN